MRFILSEVVRTSFNKLFSNRRFYITDKSFCSSFISYLHDISEDFNLVASNRVKFDIKRDKRYSVLSKICILYKISNQYIIIYDIWFVGLSHLYRLCNYERNSSGYKLGKRPNHIKPSASLSDYRVTYFKGGEINGTPVKIVQRINMTSRSNKPLFNYLYNGRLLSRYDMLNLTPFTIQRDGELKAYGDAVNGKRYWIYPNGKWRLLREGINNNQVQKIRLTETQFKEMLIECITKIIKEIA